MSYRDENTVPAYRKMADKIIREIETGELPPGAKLPAVRELARENGLSPGTAMHVYNALEREGYLVKAQGKGTFVRRADDALESRESGKARAMAAIDRLLDEMRALSFSWHETRIFIDLKLRQREQDEGAVRVAAVECSPEALAMMKEQILALPHTEVDVYLLDPLLAAEHSFDPRADVIVTTATHGDSLSTKLMSGREPVVCLVMSLDAETAVELAAIDRNARVGVICKSERFAQIVLNGCERYCKRKTGVSVAHFGDLERVRELTARCDVLILPPNRRLFASSEEDELIRQSENRTAHILYRYRVESGSLVYLESRIREIYRARMSEK